MGDILVLQEFLGKEKEQIGKEVTEFQELFTIQSTLMQIPK